MGILDVAVSMRPEAPFLCPGKALAAHPQLSLVMPRRMPAWARKAATESAASPAVGRTRPYSPNARELVAGIIRASQLPAKSMQPSNYTSQNIARALGLNGFENDEQLAAARLALRLLLLPSFHPELCVSFTENETGVAVSVAAANEQVWQQVWPSPKPAQTCKADAVVTAEQLAGLVALARNAAAGSDERVVMLDGMKVHTILRVDRQLELDLNANVGQRAAYAEFVAKALQIAWHAVAHPQVRNALRAVGSYVGLALPEQLIPPVKPTVRTVVLGPEEVASQLLEALKRGHKG